ncbi:MAG: hypothetical protein COB62_01590 [Piscirickettsiaceae bacterium]|nr:MAG: hypothetical protein COB62_01590 [Piscirickettsiaceae bacterium]
MSIKKSHKSIVTALIILVSALTGNALSAKSDFNIAVFYPDVRKPFSTFFEAITDGIEKSDYANISIKSVAKEASSSDISDWLKENKPDAVILLGSSFKRYSKELDGPFEVIYGATFFSNTRINQGHTGVSITPDPTLLFGQLKKLSPSVKQVNVVYHPQTNNWLIERAEISAKNLNLILKKYPVENIQQAAAAYRDIISTGNFSNHALWLLQHEPTLDEKSLLPKILADAWRYQQIVFSSNSKHVKRGALFSLLPDNNKLGEDLAKKTVTILNGGNKHIETMRSSLVVANIRTAKHLSLSSEILGREHFAITYPRQK